MSKIVQLDERRAASQPGYAVCECGSAWFELVEQTNSGRAAGTVTLTTEGAVGGYTGVPCCVECGRKWSP